MSKLAARVRTLKSPRRLAHLKPGTVVWSFALLYMVVFAALSVYKHEIFASSRFDLGNMDQAVWNSVHGRILQTTDENGQLVSRLKNHADLLLLAFVPLYWLHPSPVWLLTVQAVAVGFGAVPLYRLSLRFLGREWPAAFISIAYLFNPGIQAANLFDFHAQTMAGTFLLFSFYYLLERRLRPFLIFAALAALSKEEISLIVAMMGLYVIWPLRRPRWGIPVFLAGISYFILVMLILIPAFNSGDPSRLVAGRYEAFGGSIGGVVRTALEDPLFVLGYIFSAEQRAYLAYLTGLAGFFGLLAPFLLVLPLPEMAINLLSERPQMISIRYQYSAPIIPFMYLAAAAGINNLIHLTLRFRGWRRFPGRWLRRFMPGEQFLINRLPAVLAVGVLMLNIQMNYNIGPLPGFHSPSNTSSAIDPAPADHLKALNEAVALIPNQASVSATNLIGAHLSERRYLYVYPMVHDADYVILDETNPGYDTYINPVLNLQSTQDLREDQAYRLIYSNDGVLVFKRMADPVEG